MPVNLIHDNKRWNSYRIWWSSFSNEVGGKSELCQISRFLFESVPERRKTFRGFDLQFGALGEQKVEDVVVAVMDGNVKRCPTNEGQILARQDWSVTDDSLVY